LFKGLQAYFSEGLQAYFSVENMNYWLKK